MRENESGQMDGLRHFPRFLDEDAQAALIDTLRRCVAISPLFQPVMPRSGRPFSVRMTNLGALGWVSDRSGYRYQSMHPATGAAWPPIPEIARKTWVALAEYPHEPECCLLNHYSAGAKMGLHRDEDEEIFDAPVVSLSLGDTAVFRIGGLDRKDKTRSFKLQSGDALVLADGARLAYHGVDRIVPNSSDLLTDGGRINLTMRRVTAAK
jgi:alkylated DNA repair protein (DNA oxidative demethylase)